jgi:hypothetical protein
MGRLFKKVKEYAKKAWHVAKIAAKIAIPVAGFAGGLYLRRRREEEEAARR